MSKEPIFDVAQLAHVEIYSPKPDETLWFFKELLGMEETTRQGQSVYLRAYEDFYHHTLKITEAKEPGMGHVAWRASSETALERRVQALDASGYGQKWIDGDLGHGAAYQFVTPDGHQMEILWDVEYYQAPEEKKSQLLSRPQKKPLRGVPVRRLDHVNLLASDVTENRSFLMDQLGFRLRENIVMNNQSEAAAWLSVSPLVHELAFMGDQLGGRGRLHHLCYWYGYPQHLSDIADIFTENGIKIEAGPGKHGVSQAYFLYVVEPGGNRVELFGDAGYLIFDPAWQPVTWKEEQLEKGIIWYGSPLPAEFFMYGTPVIEPAKV
ncbi:catechol 2,3-dioxygenase [Brevibacillus centrosporus]|uniref:Metapyrocatechase n=4 Tax=Brevibacillus centrosporus TaxID=54910 RepID=A0A1I3ZCR1_9BACL|nr:catechol 2,3-dioxygenase [Brevibacillus centrosporus]MEC2132898.1 catechol 2,3-dioxygenase [Brevibacillus centrosporus]MEC2132901.1 catechol 2,3-dioxygenase [Brevibacillus centrosporus]MED4911524.1 catechol 2,3-dioxygenase [Brevibacillus centrosporus]MED4911527.1 catechol 2,3-dioxygenase [Brevibacillus centrosporus]RNB64233.1 catechol 2,3-dioxygenase [Brevibacillus centrosporus]